MGKWYLKDGNMSDIVISTRIRLARNFEDYVFPESLDDKSRLEIFENVKNIFANQEDISSYTLDTLSEEQLGSFVEKHIISPEFANNRRNSKGLIVRNEGEMSIMVNEEDHLRMQFISSGFQLDEIWRIAESVDKMIESRQRYAFSNSVGYLTSCLTNVGTALRASVMLHLPAFCITKKINSLLEACNKMGFAVRGLYGEHSKSAGYMFQISNQVSLGHTELEIIDNVKRMVLQIIEKEKNLRKVLHDKEKERLDDKIYRAVGILKYAKLITKEESFGLFSDIRLGISMGILKDIDILDINALNILVCPYTLQLEVGRKLNSYERDIERAKIIQGRLK